MLSAPASAWHSSHCPSSEQRSSCTPSWLATRRPSKESWTPPVLGAPPPAQKPSKFESPPDSSAQIETAAPGGGRTPENVEPLQFRQPLQLFDPLFNLSTRDLGRAH